jgi:hypothetical protein
MRVTAALALLAVFAGAVVGGCAVGESGDPAGEPPIGQLLNVEDLRTFSLPLDPYRVSPTNLRNSTLAERVLMQRCIARLGSTMWFRFRRPSPRQSWGQHQGLTRSRPYMIDTIDR